jgi:hypothetical protein
MNNSSFLGDLDVNVYGNVTSSDGTVFLRPPLQDGGPESYIHSSRRLVNLNAVAWFTCVIYTPYDYLMDAGLIIDLIRMYDRIWGREWQ